MKSSSCAQPTNASDQRSEWARTRARFAKGAHAENERGVAQQRAARAKNAASCARTVAKFSSLYGVPRPQPTDSPKPTVSPAPTAAPMTLAPYPSRTRRRGALARQSVRDAAGATPLSDTAPRRRRDPGPRSSHSQQAYHSTVMKGSVHSNWNQFSTRTGRLSCSNPNLQQVSTSTQHHLLGSTIMSLAYRDQQ